MIRIRRPLFLTLLLIVASTAPVKARASKLSVSVNMGLNLISFYTAPIGHSDNYVGLTVGTLVNYLFRERFGIFLGSDLAHRGTPLIGGETAAFDSLELPFGGIWNHGNAFFPKNARLVSRLGAFFSHPLSNLKVGNREIQQANDSAGAYVGISGHFELGPSTALGGIVWGKFGIMKSFKPSPYGESERLIEVGLGASVLFNLL